jgi:addiction module HigA family antidote
VYNARVITSFSDGGTADLLYGDDTKAARRCPRDLWSRIQRTLIILPLNRLNEVVRGRRAITADTALRLAALFKMSPECWMNLQASWDLHQARMVMKKAG